MFTSTRQLRRLFGTEIWSLKASVERIAVCACFCKFSARLVICWLFEFFPYFVHEHGKGTINSQHLFIFSCSEYLDLQSLSLDICSLGVNFLQNSCWYHSKRAPNSLLQLTWIIVDMVWSMIFLLSDIKVVFDRLFWYLCGEREREKKNLKEKNEKRLNGKPFQINLKGMIIRQGRFCSDFHEYAIYCGIAWRQTVFRIYHNS